MIRLKSSDEGFRNNCYDRQGRKNCTKVELQKTNTKR